MLRTELWDPDGELKEVRGGIGLTLAKDKENVQSEAWPGS